MVVVITDHHVTARHFRQYFTEDVECDCATFLSTDEAAAAMKRHPPRLLVFDARRWPMSGLRELRRLGADAIISSVPAIVLSTNPDHEPLARELSLLAFLHEPVVRSDFEHAVRRAVPVGNVARACRVSG